jgi:hypothetical protein
LNHWHASDAFHDDLTFIIMMHDEHHPSHGDQLRRPGPWLGSDSETA